MKKPVNPAKLDLSIETLLPLTRDSLDVARGGFAQRTENCTNTSIPCTRPTRPNAVDE